MTKIPDDNYLLGLWDGGQTLSQIGARFGKTKGWAQGRVSRLRKKLGGDFPTQDPPPAAEDKSFDKSSIRIHVDGSQSSDRLVMMSEEERKNPRRLLELHNYDPDTWVLVDAVDNLWHMKESWRIGGGRELLYQSKIRARPLGGNEFTFQDVESFFNHFEGVQSSGKYIPKQFEKNSDILEICLSDMHIGKRGIYSDRHADIKKAFRYTVEDIIDRCQGRSFSKIYLTPLGDIFNFDTMHRTTTAGTPVESDGSTLPEMVGDGTELFMWALDGLQQIAPVEFKHLPGNHDWMMSFMFAKMLEFYYKPNDFVTVDADPQPRKWTMFGKSLVGWAHGELSRANASTWLVTEARQDWGRARWAEIHSGHIHSQQTTEKNGVVLRYLPSMTATDEWHYNKGYVGATKATVSFVWDMTRGLKEIWHTNLI